MVNVTFVEQLGKFTLSWIAALGDYVRFISAIIYWIFRGSGRFARQQLLQQLFEVGTLSIPVVMITGGFIGAVMSIETGPQFVQIGLGSRLGTIINLTVIKQIGPVLTSVMLAGRVGGALTAELGTMKVTEQIDAMRAMAANPIRCLAVPRFAACIMMMPALTVFSDVLGMLGGWLLSVHILGVDSTEYWKYTRENLENYTIITGFLKTMFFGGAIASIACYKGFNAGSGAQGVGKACTEAFVTSFVVILVMNFFLAMLMNSLYEILWPGQPSVFA
jgi:phospholipid/cholesterol/gamma-HCH transport system permease protein